MQKTILYTALIAIVVLFIVYRIPQLKVAVIGA